MIDRSDLRTVRTDLLMVGVVAAAFVLGGLAVELNSGGPVAAGGAVALAGGVVWYLDEAVRLPELDHGEAADALRDAADELDRLDDLTREALLEAIDEDEVDVDSEELSAIEDLETLRDLAERSGLEGEVVVDGGGSA